MGALFGIGIDNALIEIDNEEVPILDGSAKLFIKEILTVGLQFSNKPIKIIKINKKVEFKSNEKFISIEPSKLSLIRFSTKISKFNNWKSENKINVYKDDLTEVLILELFVCMRTLKLLRKRFSKRWV